MKPKILIVDDQKPLRDTLARWFRPNYDCLTAPDAAEALKVISETPDLALMISDVNMPPEGPRSGVELLKRAKALRPGLACILLTAYGTVDLAVEAMHDGADDFFQKPITDLEKFELRVAKAVRTASFEKEAATLSPQALPGLDSFTGTSPAMDKVYRVIRKVAPTEATVLIDGPSGSGKELTARAIHDLSKRAGGPFVAVECAALPTSLLETELFGSVKGAYTDARDRAGCFETADGGTLFLDEIGEIDLSVQVKLLRVLESRTFQRVGESTTRTANFRLVAATNRDFRKLIAEGKFRDDLYYRLNVIDIHLPALKDRPGDIPLLARRFLDEFSTANGGAVKAISPDAMKAIERYSWPGNVRQLRNVIEKMVVLAGGDTLGLDDVPPEIVADEPAASPIAGEAHPPAESPAPSAPVSPAASTGTLADSEKQQILAALAANRNNKSRAAEALGISRRTLHRKLNEWGLK